MSQSEALELASIRTISTMQAWACSGFSTLLPICVARRGGPFDPEGRSLSRIVDEWVPPNVVRGERRSRFSHCFIGKLKDMTSLYESNFSTQIPFSIVDREEKWLDGSPLDD